MGGVLLDLEGVLYQDGRPIDGAIDAVAALRDRGLAIRFLTNTTTRPRGDIHATMLAMGFKAARGDIFSPAMAAGSFLKDAGVTRIHLAARLVALHKNRYCQRGDGRALDLGPFVAALEYAADIEADVMGKPSPAFFAMALASLGLAAGDVVMVGDDIEADIGGAQGAGLRAVQVETGKYSAQDLRHARIAPDGRIPSITGLPAFMAAMP